MSQGPLRGATAIVGVAESDLGDVGADRYAIDLAAQAALARAAETVKVTAKAARPPTHITARPPAISAPSAEPRATDVAACTTQ